MIVQYITIRDLTKEEKDAYYAWLDLVDPVPYY